jgi:hypothetical protein
VAERRRVVAALIALVVPVRISHAAYEARVTWTPTGEALRLALAAVGALRAA